MAFTIFFATSTGKTEDVADRLKELIPGTEAKDVDNISSIDELVSAKQLIVRLSEEFGLSLDVPWSFIPEQLVLYSKKK